jgi:hypothetical protein
MNELLLDRRKRPGHCCQQFYLGNQSSKFFKLLIRKMLFRNKNILVSQNGEKVGVNIRCLYPYKLENKICCRKNIHKLRNILF